MNQSTLIRQCVEYLNLKPLWRASCVKTEGKLKGGQRVKLAEADKHKPDVIACGWGKYVGIEVKLPGDKQSPGQKDYQKDIERTRGIYWIVESLEDLDHKVRQFETAITILNN